MVESKNVYENISESPSGDFTDMILHHYQAPDDLTGPSKSKLMTKTTKSVK